MATKRPRRARGCTRLFEETLIHRARSGDLLLRVTSPTRDHGVLVRMAAFIALQLSLLGAIAVVAALCFGWDRARRTGLLLASLFSNSGNAGLPLSPSLRGALPGSQRPLLSSPCRRW